MLQFRLRTLMVAVTLLATAFAVVSQWSLLPPIVRMGVVLASLTSILVGISLVLMWLKRRADFAGEEGREASQAFLVMAYLGLGLVWLIWILIIAVLIVVETDSIWR